MSYGFEEEFFFFGCHWNQSFAFSLNKLVDRYAKNKHRHNYFITFGLMVTEVMLFTTFADARTTDEERHAITNAHLEQCLLRRALKNKTYLWKIMLLI